jgi:hypothetical protein
MLKIGLVAFLSAVGIWAAIGFWRHRSIEKRVRAAEITIENATVLTPEEGFKVVSATADHEGNVCLEYTSHNARRLDEIGYAVYERGETKVRFSMDVDEWDAMCSSTPREDFTSLER